MSSGRTLPNATRCGLAWKSLIFNKALDIPHTRTIVSQKGSLCPSELQPNRSCGAPINSTIITKRFFHENRDGGEKTSSSSSTAASSYLAGIGVLALGCGAILHRLKDDKSDLSELSLIASCAKEKGKGKDCGCVEKKCEDSPCIHQLDCEEELIRKANNSLEKALRETKSKAVQHTEAAMKAYCEAIMAMQEYLCEGYELIDNDKLEPPIYEEAWCCFYQLAKKRCEKVKDAIIKGQCAWALLCKLEEVIEGGKACKYTSCNPLLPLAEETLKCGQDELIELKKQMDSVSSDSSLVKCFRKEIEAFWKDLREEMCNLPAEDVCDVTFKQQETAVMINLAYKRIVRMHKLMAHTILLSGNIPDKQSETMC